MSGRNRKHPFRLAGSGERSYAREAAQLTVGRRTHVLKGEGPWVVGRSKSCDVVIRDHYISRRHAKIYREGDDFFVEDLDSANGTTVGGEYSGDLRNSGRIERGAELSFGKVRACFQRPEENEKSMAPPARRRVGLPYLPGLDGLRALAVTGVLLYHASVGWLPGGFLGVSIFFVLSGYLITSLLLVEYKERGRISLKSFWFRRARRLLPAVYLMILVILAYSVLFLPDQVARLRETAEAAFFYVTNWYLVFHHESYFQAMGRPLLFQHLWSLAVEEQFYLVWPLLFLTGMKLLGPRKLLALTVALATGASLLMALLYNPNVDPSRLYYGTDTRSAELLFGAALAFLYRPRASRHSTARHLLSRGSGAFAVVRRRWGWTSPLLLDALGLVSLGVLASACLLISEYQPFLYRGGFAALSLATVATVAAAVHPRSRLVPRLLGLKPLRWVGVRSYGIYLWHWPVFEVTRPGLDVPLDGLPLLALRLSVTLAIAAISYRLVESPIRRGALERAWKSSRRASGTRRLVLRGGWAAVLVVGVACLTTLGVNVANTRPPAQPAYATKAAIHFQAQSKTSGRTPESKNPDKAETKQAGSGAHSRTASEGKSTSTSAASAAAETSVNVSAIGDSVTIDAATYLERDIPNLRTLEARVGLQVEPAIAILKQRRAEGRIGQVVVVALGTNGTFTSEEFDEIMGVLSGAQEVIFVNNAVPRPWEASNNEAISEGVQRYPSKAMLVNWYAVSSGHPEYFWQDGVHLTPHGSRAYAHLVRTAFESATTKSG